VQINPQIINPPEWLVLFVLRVMSPFVYNLSCKMLDKVARGIDSGAVYLERMVSFVWEPAAASGAVCQVRCAKRRVPCAAEAKGGAV